MTAKSSLPQQYQDLLSRYEAEDEPISLAQVYDDFLRIQKAHGPFLEDMSLQLRAELIALGTFGKPADERSIWGTLYLQPIFEGSTPEGKPMSSPSFDMVGPDMLGYWEARARECPHPILKARYADLAWDFSELHRQNRPSIDCARMACDAYVEAVREGKHKFNYEAVHDIKRALQIAIQVNDEGRTKQVAEVILGLEEQLGSRDGGWNRSGLAFELLVDNKKVSLPEGVLDRLIQAQEQMIVDVAASQAGADPKDPHAAEAAAQRLASYYRRHERLEDARRVIRAYGEILVQLAKTANGLQASSWLQKVHAVYVEYGMKPEAESLVSELTSAGKRAVGEMKTVSHEMEFPKDELDRRLDELCQRPLPEILGRIVAEFRPSIRETIDQIRELAATAPLLSIIGHEIMDGEGRVIARIGSVDEDLDGRVIAQLAQNMSLSAPFLGYILNGVRVRTGLTAEQLVSLLYGSPLFEENRRDVLLKGLQAYLDRDHVVAVHLLVPQIEHALRRLVQLSGGAAYKARRGGGFLLKNLDELLREPSVQVAMGEDFVRYLQALLTDQRGMNLRNDVLHGIVDPGVIGRTASERVLHVLLWLAQTRERKQDAQAGPDPEQPRTDGV